MGHSVKSDTVYGSSNPHWYTTLRLEVYSLEPETAPDAVLSLHAKGGRLLGMVRFRPADYTGDANVVVHCHLLAHEDGGMMLVTSILP